MVYKTIVLPIHMRMSSEGEYCLTPIPIPNPTAAPTNVSTTSKFAFKICPHLVTFTSVVILIYILVSRRGQD